MDIVYPFPQAQAVSGFPTAAAPNGCRPHLPYVRENFVVPAVGQPVIVKVTDSSSLTVGQGILIGNTFYQITDIFDSIQIELMHAGLGATVGFLVVATHPAYGCYQYPVVPCGKVCLDFIPNLVTLNAGFDQISELAAIQKRVIHYGFVGPTTVEIQAEVQLEIQAASTYIWLGIELPVAPKTTGAAPCFSALAGDTAPERVVPARLGGGAFYNFACIGGATFGANASARHLISGRYEVEV